MGERGPNSQSEEMKQRKGNPDKRKPPKSDKKAQALTKLPPAPRGLNKDGKAEWRRLGTDYVSRGKLTKSNLMALEMYCLNYQVVKDAREKIADEGIVAVSGQGGHKMPHPAISTMNTAQKNMRDWQKVIENTKAQIVTQEKSELEKFRERKKAIRRVK